MKWPFTRQIPVVQKSLSTPTDEEFALFTGLPVGSHSVGLATALTVPAVASAVGLISGSIAAFDILVERKDGSQWKADDSHPVAELLHDQPNDDSSTYELIRDLIASALTSDKGGLGWVNRVDGKVLEIVRYESSHFTVDYSGDGRMERSFRINNRPEPRQNIIHLRGPFSRCPLSLASESIGVSKTLETHVGNFFKNGARPSGQILSPKTVGDTGVVKMLKGWNAAHQGADKAGSVPVFWDGTKFEPLSFNSTDSQTLELWKFIILEVARAFRVPPSMLYDFDRATWSNMESAQKEWLASLELWMQPLEGAMRRALFTDDERRDYRIRFDTDDYSNVDLTARATAAASLIACRAINANEARTWLLDLQPGPAELDAFVNPNTGSSQPGSSANGGATPQEPNNAA